MTGERTRAEVERAMLRDAVARRITVVLGEHGLDMAPLDWVTGELRLSERAARDAIARHPGLGVHEQAGRTVVWSVHPAPIAAGFQPTPVDDRLMLRLPTRRPLFLGGVHLGAAQREQLAEGIDELRLGDPGVGELGHAVSRLAQMARSWLTVPHEPAAEVQRAQWLFERIAHAWRHSHRPIASLPGLRVHRVRFDSPVGIRYWLGKETAHHLELVTWRDEHDRTVLLNVYPAGTDRPSFQRSALQPAIDSVVGIGRSSGALLGTGVVVGGEAVLTARHVIEGVPLADLTADGKRVAATLTVPLHRFARARDLAAHSAQRFATLTGSGTSGVDLAMLTVPGLARPAADVRTTPLAPSERLVIAGYPLGRWTLTSGPVTGVDDSDYLVKVMLGPGSSGAPTIDAAGKIAGVVSLDHPSAGAIVVGPALLAEFIAIALRRGRHHDD